MKKLLLFFCLLVKAQVFAQSSTIMPGNVLPRLTTAQRLALGAADSGTLVFDINTLSYWYAKRGEWIEIISGGATANYWELSANSIRNINSAGFWSKNPTALPVKADNNTHPPVAPVNEAGTRLMWIPARSAFRVGTVDNTAKWSADSIGLFSFGTGFNTVASGRFSTSMGIGTKAYGTASTALGNNTMASGNYATALGNSSSAIGVASTAIGLGAIADGDYSTAMGTLTNTAGQKGSFVMGDSDPEREGPIAAFANDIFMARFRNGYFLLTGGALTGRGATLGLGQTAWSAYSDSTHKEKIVVADGENFLLKLRGLRLGSWNYKGETERFYGPMAQEIFAAYGKDTYGTIGTDTTVSTLNMDGLLFIFSQTLEKRTHNLQAENLLLKQQLEAEKQKLNDVFQLLNTRVQQLETLVKDKYIEQTSDARRLSTNKH
ncbi:tail fiber domain-containing protein [Emticicia agri]|uniref:Peptidase S74 domain-containing protein n=1 Tax=Emticicia agri TaxID=2492393 RepID=A0A4V1ZCL2_9BACT|nr:tail fiber domain-containing protein [Emticicia agri]RYU93050.1 hypothetical protein EWM59_23975 [Emticicia agri]